MFSFLSSYIFPPVSFFPCYFCIFLFLLHFVHQSLSIQVNSFWVRAKICEFYFYLVFSFSFPPFHFLGLNICFSFIHLNRILFLFYENFYFFYFLSFNISILFFLLCLLFLPFFFSSLFFIFPVFFVQLLFFKVFSVSYLSLFLFFCRSYPLQNQYKLVQDNLPNKWLNHAKATTHSLTFLSADSRPFLTDTRLVYLHSSLVYTFPTFWTFNEPNQTIFFFFRIF